MLAQPTGDAQKALDFFEIRAGIAQRRVGSLGRRYLATQWLLIWGSTMPRMTTGQ